jgi:hypothetical protein
MYNTDMPNRAELPTTKQLLRSTAIAAASAAAILVAIVLPSEYGIDPTGIGGALNLTEMGEIKTQLAEEAAADAAADRAAPAAAPGAPAPAPAATALPERQSSILGAIGSLFVSSAHAQEARNDEMRLTLAPGEGAEIKMTMKEGEVATYAWSVEGGVVNFDMHGDGGGQETSYEKGRGQPSDEGQLTAAFAGNHGWFWRNRGSEPVTVVLKTSGTYTVIERKV